MDSNAGTVMQDSLAPPGLPPNAAQQRDASSTGSRTLHEADSATEHTRTPPLSLQSNTHNSDTASRSPWARKILLSLDGGGIRGYSSLLILQELVSLVRKLEEGSLEGVKDDCRVGHDLPFSHCTTSSHYPWHQQHAVAGTRMSHDEGCESHNNDDRPLQGYEPSDQPFDMDFKIHHYFDYVAGTSTGGLSAIMLSRLQMDIDLALQQYDIVGKQVFANPRKFSLGKLRRPKYKTIDMNTALQEVIMNALPKQVPGVQPDNKARARFGIKLQNDNQYATHTTVISHRNAAQDTYMFRSYDHPDPRNGDVRTTGDHLNPGPAHVTNLWEVARATAAAPGYFEKIRISNVDYIDGGLGCNNPAKIAFKDVRQIHGMQPPILVLSIGTGAPAPHSTPSEPERRSGSTWQHLKDMFMAFKSSIRLATDSEEVHNDLKSLIADIKQSPLTSELHYYRFNVPNILHIELDEWLPRDGETTKAKLRTATRTYLDDPQVHQDLIECAVELIKLRRARSRTERWEQFATATVYKCKHQNAKGQEDCVTIPFESRAKLRQHAFEMHGYVWRVTLDQGQLPSQEAGEQIIDRDSKPNWLFDDHYLCIWDECGQVKPVVFASEEGFKAHLKDTHGIATPTLKTRHGLEKWLDEGRTTMGELRRQATDLKKKEEEERRRRALLEGNTKEA